MRNGYDSGVLKEYNTVEKKGPFIPLVQQLRDTARIFLAGVDFKNGQKELSA